MEQKNVFLKTHITAQFLHTKYCQTLIPMHLIKAEGWHIVVMGVRGKEPGIKIKTAQHFF